MTPDHLATVTMTLFGLVLAALTWEVRQLRRKIESVVTEDRCEERRKEHDLIMERVKELRCANSREHDDLWRAMHAHKHADNGDVIPCPHTRNQ